MKTYRGKIVKEKGEKEKKTQQLSWISGEQGSDWHTHQVVCSVHTHTHLGDYLQPPFPPCKKETLCSF